MTAATRIIPASITQLFVRRSTPCRLLSLAACGFTWDVRNPTPTPATPLSIRLPICTLPRSAPSRISFARKSPAANSRRGDFAGLALSVRLSPPEADISHRFAYNFSLRFPQADWHPSKLSVRCCGTSVQLSGRATLAPLVKVWRTRGVAPIPTLLAIRRYLAATMSHNYASPTVSIFQGGKLKPGIYKIRNLVSRTYVDTKDDVRELCGRPSISLEDGRGQVSSSTT